MEVKPMAGEPGAETERDDPIDPEIFDIPAIHVDRFSVLQTGESLRLTFGEAGIGNPHYFSAINLSYKQFAEFTAMCVRVGARIASQLDNADMEGSA